ncbi:DUF423 domain-containing protein [Kurthia massiliensis]|uniref:DUF423 domain-containing protein n=1 Tax=Kurthia massiliensis TaxID=1033739 RepID=UPI000288CFE8|nr:DUF423 domain-containing protein [Kurthia massiliensis]
MKKQLMIGSVLGFLAVALGAFGAHALSDILAKNGYEDIWETGVHYQMFHAIVILVIGVLMHKNVIGNVKSLRVAGTAMLIGVILFAGSLYALALTKIAVLGAITPIGGVSMLIGWVALLMSAKHIKD